jgi:hypothetical protein
MIAQALAWAWVGLLLSPHYYYGSCHGLRTISITNNPAAKTPVVDRRAFGVAASTTSAATFGTLLTGYPSFAATASISQRLEQDLLYLPSPSYAPELNGVDNTYFPAFLTGTWNVTQTLVSVKTPLGLKFAGGPNGDITIAKATMDQMTREQLNKPVPFQLRYIHTKWGVAEDRLFNTRQRLNAFAGKVVVASVDYANVGGSNRPSVVALGGLDTDPLQTTIVRFKGPAAQKTFIVSHGGDPVKDPLASSWAGYELQRSIFALTNQNTAPPITTDSELVWKFEKLDDSHVRANFRIAEYLNAQNDKLYFEAAKRAVTLQDYVLFMIRVSE